MKSGKIRLSELKIQTLHSLAGYAHALGPDATKEMLSEEEAEALEEICRDLFYFAEVFRHPERCPCPACRDAEVQDGPG